ncbi:MAG: (2Fe-2S)-binding protein [Bacillota bacterium]
MKEDTIVCRCEDISLGELRKMIKDGHTTLDEIKRVSRLGMGPCQGDTCMQIAAREIANITGKDLSEIKMPTSRPPKTGIKLKELAGEYKDEE